MKKILLALAIMPLFFVACSSDDDIPSSEVFGYSLDLLYGEWRVTSVEALGPIDLTQPEHELYVTPTYLKFEKDGVLSGEGVLGEGTGRYSTQKETIHTSIGKKKLTLEVTSLIKDIAKVKLDAKYIPHPFIKDDMGMVTLTLKKNHPREINFDYEIKHLYGKWRATSIDAQDLTEGPIPLNHPAISPVYLTFDNKGVFSIKNILREGKGRYTTKEKSIYTLIDKDRLDFEVISLNATTVEINVNPKDFGYFEMEKTLKDIKLATVEFTKEKE